MSWHNGDYPTATSLGDSDIFLGAQSGASVVFNGTTLKDYISARSANVLYTDTTLVGTPASTSVQALFTYTLPASTLSVDGWFVHVRAWGFTGGNANAKRLLFNLGGTNEDSGVKDLNNYRWEFEAHIIRTAAGNQDVRMKFTTTPAITWGDDAGSTVIHMVTDEWTENLNSDLDIVLQGRSSQDVVVAASDVVYQGSIILLNA